MPSGNPFFGMIELTLRSNNLLVRTLPGNDLSMKKIISYCLLILPGLFILNSARAQDCPPNIDFERGDFTNWTCYLGTVNDNGDQNNINLSPVPGPLPDHHTLFSAAVSGNVYDPYGNFPVVCPNGSNHSVKLGNNLGGAQAEGLSYEFVIPPGRNTYALIYHYAVVFQDPNHLPFQQPRLELQVQNLTDGELISCSSFTFFPNGSPLPGFFQSPLSDSTAVWCKDWSAVSINLNNMAGKRIRLFFKTADCTFRRHFGYAYIDVNSECSDEFTGATFCPDDTAIYVTAPYGYERYEWYSSDFTQHLGSDQVLNLAPPPPPGTTIAVILNPYAGYGCLDTLYAKLVDTLKLKANAGFDVTSCNNTPVLIGSTKKNGVVYSWSPTTALTDPAVSNPLANPSVTTDYELTVRSQGGGCMNKDTVTVTASVIDSTLTVQGKTLFCITNADSAVFSVAPTDSIQWYINSTAITGANQPRYKATQSGTYYAKLFTDAGCTLDTRKEQVVVEVPRRPVRYPLQYAVLNYPVQLSARDFGVEYLWRPPFNLDDITSPKPNFNTSVLDEYLYTVDITTAAGCLTVDTQLVKTIKEVKVYVPTAFTPNNDGLNDYLRPILLGVKELKSFKVFNRWGQVVYEMHGNERGWDGNVKGQVQSTSVYVWMMEAIGLDNRRYFQKGTVLLMK